MKKRTKFEIVIMIIVAIIYFASMLMGKNGGNQPASPQPSTTIQQQVNVPTQTTTQQTMQETEKETETETQTMASTTEQSGADVKETESAEDGVEEDQVYTDKDSVALYLNLYGHLPDNYITKNDAKELGWDSEKGNLDEVCPGMSIGGDKFGNYEGQLPKKKGRKYFECDINYNPKKGFRGAERIIYSNDGLVYYTGDHYNTFELLYGEP